MPTTRRSTLLALLALALVAASCGGGGGDGAAASGRYVGDTVSFRLGGGQATDFRLQGVSCRVPHPLNPDVVSCLERAPGFPDGVLPLTEDAFSGSLGGVTLSGAVDGDTAAGTWTFVVTCDDGSTCEAAGTWTATRVAEPVGPDAGPDASPPADVPGDDGTGPTPDVPVVPDVGPVGTPPGASPAQVEAAGILGAVRARVGLETPDQDADVNAAAQAHAEYYVLHAQQYASTGFNPHRENPDWEEGYTGESATERLEHQGVSFSGWSEVMAFSGSAQGAIDGWMATLYHRVPLIHPNMGPWGFGLTQDGARCEVLDTLRGPAATDDPVPWPPFGAGDVDTSWSGLESPQPPLPAGESYPSGPVITLTFPRGHALDLDSATLLGPAGAEVPAMVRSPANDPLLTSTWSVYAHDPLESGASYTVLFEGTVDGAPHTTTWSFTTR